MKLFKTTQTLLKLKKSSQNSLKNIPYIFYSIASLMAFAAINYTIIHSPFILLGIMVLIVHELAHYIYAKAFNAQAKPPIFLPLPIIAVAFVKVKNLLDEHKSHVAISGMAFGALTILIYSLFNYYFLFIPYYVLGLMLVLELLFNIIGFDGTKYRRYKKNVNHA